MSNEQARIITKSQWEEYQQLKNEEVNTGSYWSFIEKYYTNYDSADEICESNDFSLWVEGERDFNYNENAIEEMIENEVSVFEQALRQYVKEKRGYVHD